MKFWHRKLTLKVRFWHFLMNRNSSTDLKHNNPLSMLILGQKSCFLGPTIELILSGIGPRACTRNQKVNILNQSWIYRYCSIKGGLISDQLQKMCHVHDLKKICFVSLCYIIKAVMFWLFFIFVECRKGLMPLLLSLP